jgi:hypothetical protein
MNEIITTSEKDLASERELQILCFYINITSRHQIIRITNIPNWYLERVILPGQRLMFYAPAEAKLEIHSSETVTAILTDVIPCQQLSVTNAELSSSQILPKEKFVK